MDDAQLHGRAVLTFLDWTRRRQSLDWRHVSAFISDYGLGGVRVPVYRTEHVSSPTWLAGTAPAPLVIEGDGRRRYPRALFNLLRIRVQVGSDDTIVFTDDNPVTANLFGLLCKRGPRPTIVRTDPLINTPANERRRRFLHACLTTVDRLIVWAPAVADRYHASLGVPRARMVPLHFHHTLAGHDVPAAADGDYLFSGGDSMRDYPTLLEAVRGLSISVRIATRWRPPAGLPIPPNVHLGPTSPREFRALLAGARLVVFPLRTDNLRTSGQQSYLNAMALRKPVIVTDRRDAPFYIDDGRNGRLVSSGDAASLRAAVAELLDSPAAARDMGARAQDFALPLDQEHTWSRVLSLALEAHRQRGADALSVSS